MRRIGRVLARILNAVPPEEMGDIHLRGAFWEVDGRRLDYAEFFRRLPELVSEQAVLFLEGGAHPPELTRFLSQHGVPAAAKVARGTVWPRAPVFHVPTKPAVLRELGDIAENCAGPEICDHLQVYRENQVLLEWYDAFSDPFRVSKRIPKDRMQEFCEKLKVAFREGNGASA